MFIGTIINTIYQQPVLTGERIEKIEGLVIGSATQELVLTKG